MRRESPFRRTKKRLLTAELAGVGVVFALTGCALEQGSAFDRVAAIASPYSAPVRQGNWVEPEAARQLRKGMPQETVRLLLGRHCSSTRSATIAGITSTVTTTSGGMLRCAA